jgi:outer membrane murein-binding lipoprotein Lpp
MGRHDTSLFLKAQVDNLTGHVEELRSELKNSRYEATKANVDLDKAMEKVCGLYDLSVKQ